MTIEPAAATANLSTENPSTVSPSQPHPFHGLWVALATPFTAEDRVDVPALRQLVRHCVNGGVQGLLALGSTGEAATLDDSERDRVVEVCLDEAEALPVMVGTGSNVTRLAVAQTLRAQELGACGALVVTPWYNKPNTEGLVEHYCAVADAANNFPLVVYNVPGRTGLNLSPELLERLWALPSIVAVKESSGDLAQIDAVIRTAPEGKAVLAGDDGLALPTLALGGHGLVSVVANVWPALTRALTDAVLASRMAEARRHHAQLLPLIEALFAESNPVPLKAALALIGLTEDHVRAPLAAASPDTRRHLARALINREMAA